MSDPPQESVGGLIEPYFGQGFASDEIVRNVVGNPRITVGSCNSDHNDYDMQDNRSAVVTLRRVPSDFEQQGAVIDALLQNAAQRVWAACPHPFYFVGSPTNDFHKNVSSVQIVGPDGALLVSARLGGRGLDLTGDQALNSGHSYIWRDYRNGLADQRAQAVANADLEARRAARAQAEADRKVGTAKFYRNLRIALFLAFLVYLYAKREDLLRWYYGLQPHPVTGMVDSAIMGGAKIDGELYERVLSPVPGSSIEAQVRTSQAHALVERLRRHEAALKATETEIVEREIKRAEEENAFLRAHTELLKAGVDHEIAAASLEELRKAMRNK